MMQAADLRLSPAPPEEVRVLIDYVAKDYASFRQALLDFLPTRMPDWTERSEADIGMMLLELFAATGDTLSYIQDRVANEAFLDTASQRRSVVSHLALIGYTVDEGAAAYTWLNFRVRSDTPLARGFQVRNERATPLSSTVIFETLIDTMLRAAYSDPGRPLRLYLPGPQAGRWVEGCLKRGTEWAVLGGLELNHLRRHDFLLIEDTKTGYRQVVRLSAVPEILAQGMQQQTALIRWAPPLEHDYQTQRTLVWANMVPAMHGETIHETLVAVVDTAVGVRLPHLRLALGRAPLARLDTTTRAWLLPGEQQSASTVPAPGAFVQRPAASVSTLAVLVEGEPWQERATLLDSGPDDPVFRVEMEDSGYATLVFGDDVFGRRPGDGAVIEVTYRIGGGSVGNVGRDTLVMPVLPRGVDTTWLGDATLAGQPPITNPLAATGGRDLETRDHARIFGPAALEDARVAVTADDYAEILRRYRDTNGRVVLRQVVAEEVWTGTWPVITLRAELSTRLPLDDATRSTLREALDDYRLAGSTAEVVGPDYIAIDLAVTYRVRAGYLGDVQGALEQALAPERQAGGPRGFFHPDNFGFGRSLYVAQLYAAIMAVPGVASASIEVLAGAAEMQPQRRREQTRETLRRGYLAAGPDQIIRMDNDRTQPSNGLLTLSQERESR